jgi:hypothetical protein
MRLYYSGAKTKNGVQKDILKSVGGYLSCNSVPNDFMNNLFHDVSRNMTNKGDRDVIGIFLINQDLQQRDVTDVEVWFEGDDAGQMEIAAVAVQDGCKMEKLENSKALPYFAEFHAPNGQANSVILTASLPYGSIIGLWFKRTVDKNSSIDCDALYQAFLNDTELPQETDLSFKINYTVPD